MVELFEEDNLQMSLINVDELQVGDVIYDNDEGEISISEVNLKRILDLSTRSSSGTQSSLRSLSDSNVYKGYIILGKCIQTGRKYEKHYSNIGKNIKLVYMDVFKYTICHISENYLVGVNDNYHEILIPKTSVDDYSLLCIYEIYKENHFCNIIVLYSNQPHKLIKIIVDSITKF